MMIRFLMNAFHLFIGSNVQWKSQMGISIPNICDADDVANAHGAYKQTNQIDGTITL